MLVWSPNYRHSCSPQSTMNLLGRNYVKEFKYLLPLSTCEWKNYKGAKTQGQYIQPTTSALLIAQRYAWNDRRPLQVEGLWDTWLLLVHLPRSLFPESTWQGVYSLGDTSNCSSKTEGVTLLLDTVASTSLPPALEQPRTAPVLLPTPSDTLGAPLMSSGVSF